MDKMLLLSGGMIMGFDMRILQCRKIDLERALNKYSKKNINDLPYEAIENLESAPQSRLFTSRVHVLAGIEEQLPYAHETYVFLEKKHFDLAISYCEQIKKSLYPILNNDNEWEYGECIKLLEFLKDLKQDWDVEDILYEHDC